MFPMLCKVKGVDLAFVILDSNGISANIITNAFGLIDENQLSELPAMVEHLKGQPMAVVLHHHVGIPALSALPLKESMKARGLTLSYGSKFLRTLARTGRKMVVFNGHRHIRYLARFESMIDVVASPSTSLGDERLPHESRTPGFGIYDVGWNGEGDTRVVSETWRALTD